MATTKQKQWAGRGPVISVRVEPELVDRLDALAKRTGRSRCAYLRMALWAMLPQLEKIHWEQVAADYESIAIQDAFEGRNHPPLHGASHRRIQTIRQ